MKTHPTKKLGEIPFEEVLRVFDEEHHQKDGTNSWARNALIEANKKFNGRWGQLKLKRKEILGIVLPHHLGEGGEIELVPISGLNVEAAISKIKSIPEYKIKNPQCWEKIKYLEIKPFNPIFLSVSAIDWDDYKNLIPTKNSHLFHLDGLHRLIAWGLAGRLSFWKYFLNKKIVAYVAGL